MHETKLKALTLGGIRKIYYFKRSLKILIFGVSNAIRYYDYFVWN